MKLTAIVLVALGAIGTAEAQVQTNPAPIQTLPVPEVLPEMAFTGLNPDDATVLLETIRGSVSDTAPSATFVQSGAPAATAAIPNPAIGGAAGDPVPLAPGEEPLPLTPPEEAVPAAEPEPPAEQPTVVTVIVEGIGSANGTVNVALCDKGLSREGCPYTKEIQAAAGFVETQFRDIPPGRYAVVGYHDENGNNKHDRFLGVPKEPFALSSKAGSQMVPTFNDAAVSIEKGDNTFIIKMRSVLGS